MFVFLLLLVMMIFPCLMLFVMILLRFQGGLFYSDEFVEKEHCGLSVSYTAEKIQEGIIKLRDDSLLCEELGKNGLKAALEKYNWENESIKLLNVYKGLLKGKREP